MKYQHLEYFLNKIKIQNWKMRKKQSVKNDEFFSYNYNRVNKVNDEK